uniref:TNF family profile domain-containing protein n=1 Tax=Catharus ustulatus TaxID=91951 RepID=A0A8C3U0A4_CATUS
MVDDVWLWSLVYIATSPFFIFFNIKVVQNNPFPRRHLIIFASIPGRSTRGVAMNLTAELGHMQIRNGSIMIPCDGLYLVSLKSFIYLEEKEDWLRLTLQGTHKTSSSTLWQQMVHSNDTTVNLTTVLYLFGDDSITLWTSSNANISDLTLSLVLITENEC